jgi:aryl-alcohol dehydrogenase-like predicted oxidoreductase
MEHRRVGNSGLRVSLLGLGCNNFGLRIDAEASRAVIHKALDAGITLFDTADVYGNRGGSETCLGQCLGARRKDVVIASKFGSPMDGSGLRQGASRRYIVRAVEASLQRLKTDWIDLYQLHRPDPETPLEETLRALDDLVRQGKIRYIGCSSLPAWKLIDMQWTARHHGLDRLIACELEYSVLVRDAEHEHVPAMHAHGLGLLPYYPLASGLLSGKYRRGAPLPEAGRITRGERYANRFLTETNWTRVEAMEAFARGRGHSLLELAFGWLAAQPVVPSVIAGATSPEQVSTNVQAVGWQLDDAELAEIDRLAPLAPRSDGSARA